MGKDRDKSVRNARSGASSANAAAMVAAMGASTGLTFAAFDTSGSASAEAEIDTDIVLSLKKLVKRDPTTKLKALAELNSFFEDKSRADEDIAAAIPMWQQGFASASSDNDRRVREQACVVMRCLVSRGGDVIKKQIGKGIKDIVLPLLCVRFDPDTSVRTAARTAFAQLLPEAKVRAAYLHCRKEVMDGLEEALKATPETLGAGLGWSKEEGAEAEVRSLSRGALAAAHFIETCGNEAGLGEGGMGIWLMKQGYGGVWRLVQHKSVIVRAAGYAMLAAIAEHAPALIRGEGGAGSGPTAKAVLKLLDKEKDSAAMQPLWELVLMLTKGYDDCWSFDGVLESAEKGLVQSAQGVAKGSAGEVGTTALPVLLHLTLSRGGSSAQFASKVLAAMWAGMCAEGGEKGVQGRGPQMASVGQAYGESLMIALKHVGDDDVECREKYVQDTVISPMLEIVLEGKGGGASGAFARELMKVASVVAGWSISVGKALSSAAHAAEPRKLADLIAGCPCSPTQPLASAVREVCASWLKALRQGEGIETGAGPALAKVVDKWGVQILGEDSWPSLVGAVTLLVSRDGVESCQVLDAVCCIVSSVHRSSEAVNGGIGDLVGQVAAAGGRLAPLLNALGASAKKEDDAWGSESLDSAIFEAVDCLCRPGGADAVRIAEMEGLAAAGLRGGQLWLSAGAIDKACQLLASHVTEGSCSLQAIKVCRAVLEASSQGRLDGMPGGGASAAQSIIAAVWRAKECVAHLDAQPSIEDSILKKDVSSFRSSRGCAAYKVWAQAGRGAAERLCSMGAGQRAGLTAWAESRCSDIGREACRQGSAGSQMLLAEEAHDLLEMNFLFDGKGGDRLERVLPVTDGDMSGSIVFVMRFLHLRGLDSILALKGEAGIGWPVWALVKEWGNKEQGGMAAEIEASFSADVWPWLIRGSEDDAWESAGQLVKGSAGKVSAGDMGWAGAVRGLLLRIADVSPKGALELSADLMKLHPQGGSQAGCVALVASVGIAGAAWGRVGIQGTLEHLLLASPGGSGGGSMPKTWSAGSPAEHSVECGLGRGGGGGWEAKTRWEAAASVFLSDCAKIIVEGGCKDGEGRRLVALRAVAAAAKEGLSNLMDAAKAQGQTTLTAPARGVEDDDSDDEIIDVTPSKAAVAPSGEEEEDDDSDDEIIEVTPARATVGEQGNGSIGWREVLWATCLWASEKDWRGNEKECGAASDARGVVEWYGIGKDEGRYEALEVGESEMAVATWWNALLTQPRDGKDAVVALWQKDEASLTVIRHVLSWISRPGPLRSAGLGLFAALNKFAPVLPTHTLPSHGEQGDAQGVVDEGVDADEDSDDEIIEVTPLRAGRPGVQAWRDEGGACVIGLLVSLSRSFAAGESDDEEELHAVASASLDVRGDDIIASLEGQELASDLMDLLGDRGGMGGLPVCVLISAFSLLSSRLHLFSAMPWVKVAHEEDEDEGEDGDQGPSERPKKKSSVIPKALAALISRASVWGDGRRVSGAVEDAVMTTESVGILLAWLLFLCIHADQHANVKALARKHLGEKSMLGPVLSLAAAHLSEVGGDETVSIPIELGLLLGDEDDQGRGAYQLAGAVLLRSVEAMPGMVRLWFNELDRAGASEVEKFSAAVITPAVLAKEDALIGNMVDDSGGDLEVRSLLGGKEIRAKYAKDEGVLELVLKAPTCYPLKPVVIDAGRRVAVSEQRWRKWLLAIHALLTHHQGSLLDAVMLWKKNIDAVFEGVEECPICYSVIHVVNNTLPKLVCHTCNHKFHNACLYKWFNTSNKSQCPLCQSPWYT